MPRFFLLVVLLILFKPVGLFSQSLPSTISLSDRVGPVITPDERDYFNLFHRFSDFKQASFTAAGDSLRILEIMSTVNGNDVIQTDTLEAKAFNELARYIDQFEYLYDKTREVRWGLIIPYVGPKRWNRKRAKVFVNLLDGEKYEGRLVYVDNNQLVLHPGNDKVPNLSQDKLFNIDPATVETVRIRYGLVQAILFGIDDLFLFSRTRYIFGNEERYQKQVVPPLLGQSVFSDSQPPEMEVAIANEPIALTRSARPAEVAFLRRLDRQWTVKINTVSPVVRSVKSLPFTSFDEAAGSYDLELTDLIYQGTVQKNVSKRFRIGGVAQYYPISRTGPLRYFDPQTSIPLPVAQREQTRIQLSGFSVTPTFTYLLAVTDKKRYALEREMALLDRFEIAATVGPTFSVMTHHASISPSELGYLYTGFLVQVHSFTWDEFIVGGLAQLDVYFYPREYVSIGVTGEYLAFPFSSIDLAAIDNPLQEGVNYEARSFVAPSTRFEQFSLNVGLRFHF